ncbi:drug resistance transporter, EmrB/QacA subfamily [Lentzea waywayandensis]|uniref:Drug resistance transporter, EmrB/QacA subfamily n=1 Tax=Lentzea waywayandensis TaxID=84724 RepID=A0A1I6FD03_9PSEU|nr:MFS transporter [Lentzea waywayandensis]SFR27861.1 drug resistance transporter, EmrB/QacA subfamily [Lentzea waywayandensis]
MTPDRRRWWVLTVVALAQLTVVLDATIVNIALPAAQAELGFGDGDRQWVVISYSLAFGSLLLVGGRLNDRLGARTGFVIGLAGFAIASAAGGWADGLTTLVAARAAQGVFGALLAPAALSLLSTTFRGTKHQGRAFGVYGAVAGGGGAIGLLLGGVLTDLVSWRWCLFVNVVIAFVVIAGALVCLPATTTRATSQRTDWLGTVLVVAGLFALVLGFGRSEVLGWANATTIGSLAAGVALLAVFVFVQARTRTPLLPLTILRSRVRGTSYLVMLLAAVGMFSVYLFLAYYLQRTLGFSPVLAGVAFLPMAVSVAVGSAASGAVLVPRFGIRIPVAAGSALAAAGFLYLTGIGSDYAATVLPGLIMAGLGLGAVFGSAMSSGAEGVPPEQAGIASATVNTTQQIGGSIGIAVLTSLSLSVSRSGGEMAGYHAAFWGAAAALALAAVIAAVLYPRRSDVSEPVLVRSGS